MMAFIIIIVIFILKLTSLQKRVNLLENQKNNDSTAKELIQYEETQREINNYCHEKAINYYMEHDMKGISAKEAQMLINEFEEACAYSANNTLKEEK